MASPIDPPTQDPIFVLGILPRSGTNFVSDLLCLHPDCAPPAPIWEDALLRNAGALLDFAARVTSEWDPRWGVGEVEAELCGQLGDGLTRFLQARAIGRRVVTKTPRVDNLDHFFTIFPRARLIVVVRDGRSVVESGARSFRWVRDLATVRWATGARAILDFATAHRARSESFLIVRYEDLWRDLEPELRKLLQFAGLQESRYDFAAAARLPLRGSSEVVRKSGEPIHWRPVERSSEFDPLSRFSDWTAWRHARFNWIAGKELEQLGYRPSGPSGARGLWILYNAALDCVWQPARRLAAIAARLRARRARVSRAETTPAPTPRIRSPIACGRRRTPE